MIRVLIVDDDYRVAELHRTFVERCEGFDVVGTALSAAEARRLQRELLPDLVLLDLYLPDAHGLELAKELQAIHSADLMIITAARDVANIRAALHLGALNYLVKPFTFATLRDRLDRYAAWAGRLGALHPEPDQSQIDDVFRGLKIDEMARLPKGLNRMTMKLVERTLRTAREPLTAEEVSHLAGLSRVTARRYLQFLVDHELAVVDAVYGAPGRPRHLYAAR
jgi:response regulator of citrate/malate metabolism